MSGFRGFLSKLSTATGIPLMGSDKPETRIEELWRAICQQTLSNTPSSLSAIRDHLNSLLDVIKDVIKSNHTEIVIEAFQCHPIPKGLVEFAAGDSPHGIVNEVVVFFTHFATPPFAPLLRQPCVNVPLHMLFGTTQSVDAQVFHKLVMAILRHLMSTPDDIGLFYIGGTMPLIHHFSQLLATHCAEMGDVMFQLLTAAEKVDGLLEFMITYSPMISTLTDLTQDAIKSKRDDDGVVMFLECVNLSVACGPAAFASAFEVVFDEAIVKPMVLNAPVEIGLRNSMYILASFTANQLVSPLVVFLKGGLLQNLASSNESVVFLSVRAISLMVSKFEVRMPVAPRTAGTALDFMGLAKAEWFERAQMNDEAMNARARVSMSMSGIGKEGIVFDIGELLPGLLELVSKFPSNSLRLNIALTDAFASIAVIDGPDAAHFALSDSCDNGLYRSLISVCALFEANFEHTPGVTAAIERAYISLKGDMRDDDVKLFENLVVLLEFLKELHTISQSRNVMTQRDSLVIV